jgi:hypothetical protein
MKPLAPTGEGLFVCLDKVDNKERQSNVSRYEK